MYLPSLGPLRHDDVFEAAAVVACHAHLGYPEGVDPGAFQRRQQAGFSPTRSRFWSCVLLACAPRPAVRHRHGNRRSAIVTLLLLAQLHYEYGEALSCSV